MTGLLLYNLLLPVYLVLAMPGLLIKMRKRGGYGANFRQRFASYEATLIKTLSESKRRVWIHAVSVGEVLVAAKLIEEWQRKAPSHAIILSTTSSTGYATAIKRLSGVTVIFNPLDLLGIVHRALNRLQPDLLVLMESELWPNLMRAAHRRQIPIIIANARLSPRSERRYRRFRFLTKRIMDSVTGVYVQDQEDINRWQSAGIPPERISLLGSIKFDPSTAPSPNNELKKEVQAILESLWAPLDDKRILLLGSSHAGEEKMLAEIYLNVRENFPELRLALVPRHFERASEIIADLSGFDLTLVQRSHWDQSSPHTLLNPEKTCLLVDSTGELLAWYALADLVVIGKSFVGRGGQNPVEPLLLDRPVITGPHMENFAVLTASLKKEGGISQVDSATKLETSLRSWLADPSSAEASARAGKRCLERHSGATRRTVENLLEFVPHSA